jgi:hypothetical protein
MLPPPAPTPNQSLLEIECGLTGIAVASSFAWPRLGNKFFARIEKLFEGLAHKRGLAAAAVGLSMVLLRFAILPLFPVPLPFATDDFSFLLAADTFAHGRLTNPTPAMWTHFETIHVTMQPTYQSMYFPGEGLILAAGAVIFGNPWIGQLIVSALMCAALCWALQAWLPANWALLGGMIAVLRLGVFSYWTNTYHAGGSLGALGGALILGGLPRLMRTARLRYALLMGTGIAILALTRPYEGILLCLPVAVVFVNWMRMGKNRPSAAVLSRLAAAPLVMGLAAAVWLGYYDYRAFGSAFTLPYTVDRNTYAIAPYYVWQHARPEPAYRHPEMRRFYHKDELAFFNQIHSAKGFVPRTLEKVGFTFLFYSGFLLLIPMIMIRRVFLDHRVRFLLLCVAVLAAGMIIEIFLLAHYVAPLTVAFYAIGLQAMRHLRLWKPESKPVGRAMVRFTVMACVLLAGLRVFARPLGIAPAQWPPSNWNFNWFGPEHYGVERAQIDARLEELPGKQLVFVRYAPWHEPLDEWVYNRADMDSAKVVWARDMGRTDNLELIHYYADRTAWLAEPDAIPVQITPYPALGTGPAPRIDPAALSRQEGHR